MAPPIPEHIKRFTANPTRPARYRPGKVIHQEESSEEEDEEEEQQRSQRPQRPQPRAPARPKPQAAPVEEEDDDDEEGFVTEEEDEVDGGAPVPQSTTKLTTSTTQPAAKAVTAQPDFQHLKQEESEDGEEDEDEDEDEDESEEDESSEEDQPQRKFQRPTFIKKTDRQQQSDPPEGNTQHNDPKVRASLAPEISSTMHTESTAARRLAEAELQIKSTIERETAARLSGRKNWDDDDDFSPEALVDDADGIDPEAEHSAWRLRELHRLKRDREALVAREKELEEIERRRNLSKAEREAEDAEFIRKQKEEKEEDRGQTGFLAKYHHKGAFFLDDEASQKLKERNLMGARFQDDVGDKSTLPEYMRVRDMTKLGKKGRTRYTDLKGQDTGRFGDDVKRWKGSGYENRDRKDGPDFRGLDERFLPDDDRGGNGPTASGANASGLGTRRERKRSRSRSLSNDDRERRRDTRDHDSYRPRSRSKSRDRDRDRRRAGSYSSSRSRSRSPPPQPRRRRSPSPYHQRDRDRDKRRRIEA